MVSVPKMEYDILLYLYCCDMCGSKLVEATEAADDLGYAHGPFFAKLQEMSRPAPIDTARPTPSPQSPGRDGLICGPLLMALKPRAAGPA